MSSWISKSSYDLTIITFDMYKTFHSHFYEVEKSILSHFRISCYKHNEKFDFCKVSNNRFLLWYFLIDEIVEKFETVIVEVLTCVYIVSEKNVEEV